METVEAVEATANAEIPRKAERKTLRHRRGIFERPCGSGIWWIRYVDAQGRLRREKAGTWGTARDLYIKRKNEALVGRKLPEKLRRRSVPFAELCRDALEYSRAHKRTYETDRIHMETVLARFRDSAAESLTPAEIERHLSKTAEERGWKPATVNRHRALLSLVFRLALENGKVERNPVRLVKPRPVSNGRIRWLQAEEEARLRAVLEAGCPEHLPELDLALHTGLRRSEQYGLTWENVNLPRRVVSIPRSKNGQTRHVPLNGPALRALAELRKRSDGAGPVMRSLQGEPLASSRHWFEPAIHKANIRGFSWHCLRHTFASRLVMAGVDLRTVQELMGHRSIQMTCRYAHLAQDHSLAAVERLAGPVSGGATGTTTGTGPAEPSVASPAYLQ
jgi:site-specific recombinase XerD